MKVIIIGGGQVGAHMASMLLAAGHQIRLIESKETIFRKLEQELPAEVLIQGSGTDTKILELAGIVDADVVAAVSREDEVNLVVSTLAKMEYAVPRVVARVNIPKNAWLFNSQMGVDVAVNQAELMAHFVVEEMDMKDMVTLMKLNRGDYSIIQVVVGAKSKVVNQMIKDISVPKKTVLIAVIRDGKVLIPKGDTKFLSDDEVLALTDELGRKEIEVLFG